MKKIHSSKKGSAADLIIAISGIILICTAIISVLTTRIELPKVPNTAALEIINTEKKFDSLELLTQVAAVQAITNSPVVAIKGTECEDFSHDASIIATALEIEQPSNPYILMSSLCDDKKLLNLYAASISNNLDAILLGQVEKRSSLAKKRLTWFSAASFEKRENDFFADRFQVSIDVSTPLNAKIAIVSKKPFVHTATKDKVWVIDAKRDFYFKSSLADQTQQMLETVKKIPRVDNDILETIAWFLQAQAKAVEQGTPPPTLLELKSRLKDTLNDKTNYPYLDSENSQVAGYYQISATENYLIFVLPHLNVAIVRDIYPFRNTVA